MIFYIQFEEATLGTVRSHREARCVVVAAGVGEVVADAGVAVHGALARTAAVLVLRGAARLEGVARLLDVRGEDVHGVRVALLLDEGLGRGLAGLATSVAATQRPVLLQHGLQVPGGGQCKLINIFIFLKYCQGVTRRRHTFQCRVKSHRALSNI